MKFNAGQYFGKTLQTFSAEGLCFTDKSYSPKEKLPVHSHKLFHFCFVLSGAYREKIGSGEFERQPTSLIFYPPEISHAEEYLTKGRHFLVEVDFDSIERCKEYGANLHKLVILESKTSLWLAARMYKEFSERDQFSNLTLESISIELLVEAARQNQLAAEKKMPSWLEKVKECLHENYSTQIGLNELAKEAGVHPAHLARVFRQFEGCTAGDYVRKLRIEHAWKKMISSNEPLVEIALETGFTDQAHFTHSFRRETGMTPAEFRRLFKS